MTTINKIYRVSIIPFYFGKPIESKFFSDQKTLNELKGIGFHLIKPDEELGAFEYNHLIGIKNHHFLYTNSRGLKFNLYVTESGFGVVGYTEEQDFNNTLLNWETTVELLENRKEFHDNVLKTRAQKIVSTIKESTQTQSINRQQ